MITYCELEAALNTANNERDIAAFLNTDLDWLRCLNEHSWNCFIPKAEFQIGVDYRADYLILSACSGYWNCILIEMQSPTDKIYTKSNEESKGLREARRQIEDWNLYIHRNENAFREQLSKIVRGKPAYCSNASVHQSAETEIRDPHTTIFYHYKAVLGRREFLESNNARRSYNAGFEIVTFDRILDYVRNFEKANAL